MGERRSVAHHRLILQQRLPKHFSPRAATPAESRALRPLTNPQSTSRCFSPSSAQCSCCQDKGIAQSALAAKETESKSREQHLSGAAECDAAGCEDISAAVEKAPGEDGAEDGEEGDDDDLRHFDADVECEQWHQNRIFAAQESPEYAREAESVDQPEGERHDVSWPEPFGIARRRIVGSAALPPGPEVDDAAGDDRGWNERLHGARIDLHEVERGERERQRMSNCERRDENQQRPPSAELVCEDERGQKEQVVSGCKGKNVAQTERKKTSEWRHLLGIGSTICQAQPDERAQGWIVSAAIGPASDAETEDAPVERWLDRCAKRDMPFP